MAKKEKRFIKIFRQNSIAAETHIIVDKETGINYLFHSEGTGGGLTPLLGRDGKPIITTVLPEM